MSLLAEIREAKAKKTGESVGNKVREAGGGLLDEIEVRTNKPIQGRKKTGLLAEIRAARDPQAQAQAQAPVGQTGAPPLVAQTGPATMAPAQAQAPVGQTGAPPLVAQTGPATMAAAPQVRTQADRRRARYQPQAVQTVAPRTEREKQLDAINEDMNTLDTLLVSAGRGFATVGRGIENLTGLPLGIEEPEIATAAYNRLADQNPTTTMIGETIGESAPFLAAAPATGAGAVATGTGILGKAVASPLLRAIGLGVTEGGVIGAGKGETAGDAAIAAGVGGTVAGVAEAVFPLFGKLGGKLFTKALGRRPNGPILTPDGMPTPEFQQALDQTGVSFESLSEEAVNMARESMPNAAPDQVARKARFRSYGIPATRGDISALDADKAIENRLMSQVSNDTGLDLRAVKRQQSEAFKGQVDSMINELGVAADAGDAIKDALVGKKKLMRKQQRELYDKVFEADPELANTPVLTGPLAESLPTDREIRRLGKLSPEPVDAALDALAEFGIKDYKNFDGDTLPLTMETFEELRQSLSRIGTNDRSGTVRVITGPVIEALDDQIDMIANSAASKSASVANAVKEARSITRQIKTEFSPDAITGKMIGIKRDGITPMVESSKITEKLLSPQAPPEYVNRTIQSLSEAGPEGAKAINDLQASTVLKALDSALSANTNKSDGIQMITSNSFDKALDKIGKDRLDTIFGNNPEGLKKLMDLKQIARDMTSSGSTTVKGSAPIILDLAQRAGHYPIIGTIARITADVTAAEGRAAQRAVLAQPEVRPIIDVMREKYPRLLEAMNVGEILSAGVAASATVGEDEDVEI